MRPILQICSEGCEYRAFDLETKCNICSLDEKMFCYKTNTLVTTSDDIIIYKTLNSRTCDICGEQFETYEFDKGFNICGRCKQAILTMRSKFEN